MDELSNISAENIDSFIKNLMNSMVLATKSSNSGDYDYFATFPEFHSSTLEASTIVNTLLQDLCTKFNPSVEYPDVNDELYEDDMYSIVVEALDMLLEQADLSLDRARGANANSVTSAIRSTLHNDRERLAQVNAKDIPKPQMAFLDVIDNSRDTPFYPKVRPPKQLHLLQRHTNTQEIDTSEQRPDIFFEHPFISEIDSFLQHLPHNAYNITSDVSDVPPPLDSVPWEYINDVAALQRMVEEIEVFNEVAVDLEHHSHRTFQGLTCLMQLSTREKDYIVDTLALFRDMHLLAPIFHDKDIVKVLHGCKSDVLWLQRDFGLYIVNCFDTYFAAKTLHFPAFSLAHLLKYYCNVTLNKKYQLSDWRERPLSAEMLTYARCDTHYLLYVYDCMRRDVYNSFHHKGINSVIELSCRMCMERYEKEFFNPMGYQRLLLRQKAPLSQEEEAVLCSLWEWRDRIAREEDESVLFIMSNAEMLRISKCMPTDACRLLSQCAPLSSYPTQHPDSVVTAVQNALGMTSYTAPVSKQRSTSTVSKGAVIVPEKRTPLDVVVSGTTSIGAASRVVGYSTVYELLPRVEKSQATELKSGAPNDSTSWTDTSDVQVTADDGSDDSDDLDTDNDYTFEISAETHLKLEKVINDLRSEMAAKRDVGRLELTSLPKDLPAVYTLSNVNREFDKKKSKGSKNTGGGAGSGGGPEDDAPINPVQHTLSSEADVSSTLDFAARIGWIDESSKEVVREKHLTELANAQIDDDASMQSGGSSDTSHNNRRDNRSVDTSSTGGRSKKLNKNKPAAKGKNDRPVKEHPHSGGSMGAMQQTTATAKPAHNPFLSGNVSHAHGTSASRGPPTVTQRKGSPKQRRLVTNSPARL